MAPDNQKQVLFIRLSALGDVIHSLPAAAAIKNRSGIKLVWVVEEPFAELLHNNSVADEVIVFPKKALVAGLSSFGTWSPSATRFKTFVDELKTRKFDAAIDLQGLFKSGIIAYFSGAPLRVGFSEARELSTLMLTDKLNVDGYFSHDKHVVDHNVALAEFLLTKLFGTGGGFSASKTFPLPAPEASAVKRIRDLIFAEAPRVESSVGSSVVADTTDTTDTGMAPDKGAGTTDSASELPVEIGAGAANEITVALIPGTTWPSKIWPSDKWVATAIKLIDLHNVRIVLLGSKTEGDTNQYIYESVLKERPAAKIRNLTGQTSLMDLIAVFEMVSAVVGVDTGPLHLAAATGKPKIVGVYGSTPLKRNGPYLPQGPNEHNVALNLSCQPCFEKNCPLSTTACLKDLEPSLVVQEIERALGKRD